LYESLSPNGSHARLYRSDSEGYQALPSGCTPTSSLRTQRARRPVTRHPVCLTCQVRTTSEGSPRGVALLLLSPSASPVRVWLYAAELDERSLVPHNPMSTRCGRVCMQISLIPSLAGNSEDHQLRFTRPVPVGSSTQLNGDRARNTRVGNTRPRTEGRPRSGMATPNRPGAKLTDAFENQPG
jgi:hypothetical protein